MCAPLLYTLSTPALIHAVTWVVHHSTKQDISSTKILQKWQSLLLQGHYDAKCSLTSKAYPNWLKDSTPWNWNLVEQITGRRNLTTSKASAIAQLQIENGTHKLTHLRTSNLWPAPETRTGDQLHSNFLVWESIFIHMFVQTIGPWSDSLGDDLIFSIPIWSLGPTFALNQPNFFTVSHAVVYMQREHVHLR